MRVDDRMEEVRKQIADRFPSCKVEAELMDATTSFAIRVTARQAWQLDQHVTDKEVDETAGDIREALRKMILAC